jgi:hypothetical protein
MVWMMLLLVLRMLVLRMLVLRMLVLRMLVLRMLGRMESIRQTQERSARGSIRSIHPPLLKSVLVPRPSYRLHAERRLGIPSHVLQGVGFADTVAYRERVLGGT